MRILITGGTGFVGRALVLRLHRDGHQLAVMTRSPGRLASRLGPHVAGVDAGDDVALRQEMERSDAVINLAGESIIGGRWTEARKRALRDSRIQLTDRLVTAMEASSSRPKVFVSASAIGIYGDAGDTLCDEQSPQASDFLAQLCVDWEAAARRAEALGVRVVLPRIGIVLGPEGGALQKMLLPFKMGVGGNLGSGRQYTSWVHLHDLVEMIASAVTDDRMRGPFNATAPHPVTNRELTKALGSQLGRPTLIPVPSFALKVALGEASVALLTGQRVVPRQLDAWGFQFRFERVNSALRDILEPDGGMSMEGAENPPELPGARARPRYVLKQEVVLDAPIEEVFPFFSRAHNLGAITPLFMGFEIVRQNPETMGEGTTIDYNIRLGFIPLKWRTLISAWRDGEMFADVSLRGPYKLWCHIHRFVPRGQQTLMVDEVWYALPLGPLGWFAHWFNVKGTLRRIFSYRTHAMRLRFGLADEKAKPGAKAA